MVVMFLVSIGLMGLVGLMVRKYKQTIQTKLKNLKKKMVMNGILRSLILSFLKSSIAVNASIQASAI